MLEAAQAAVGEAQAGVEPRAGRLDRVRARLREADAEAAQEAKHVAGLQAAAQAARQEIERLARAVRTAEEARDRDAEACAELRERLEAAEAEPLRGRRARTLGLPRRAAEPAARSCARPRWRRG